MKSGPLIRLIEQAAETLLRQARGWATAVCLACLAIIAVGSFPDTVWGRSSSSGGYSRPSSSSSVKSFSTPTRRPAVDSSGDYTRRAPSTPTFTGSSPGDRAMSRSTSSEALRDYRAAQRPPETSAPRPPDPGGRSWVPDSGWGTAPPRRPPASGGWWGGTTASRPMPGSGILTGVALWAALNALTSPGNAEYLRANRNDPVYRDWRQEAERNAARDPAVAAKLNELDARLAQLDSQPGSAGGGPDGQDKSGSGSWSIWGIVFVVGGIIVLFWLWRRRAAAPSSAPVNSPGGAVAGLSGSAASRFRVGMVLPIDPSAFLLAAGLTKIQPPEEGGTISVETVGLLRYGDVLLHRLYLPGGKSFFQLHLGPDGQPDECRYFSVLDEVSPADPQEWAFWLDPAEGVIGWPSFQTKDGKVYGRAWGPGASRIPPREIVETRQHLDRVEERRMQAMLYGAPSGGAPPAPDTEYIMVSAIDADGQAWVEVDAGIDINPAALTLPSVSLAH